MNLYTGHESFGMFNLENGRLLGNEDLRKSNRDEGEIPRDRVCGSSNWDQATLTEGLREMYSCLLFLEPKIDFAARRQLELNDVDRGTTRDVSLPPLS